MKGRSVLIDVLIDEPRALATGPLVEGSRSRRDHRKVGALLMQHVVDCPLE